jgi:hypothetical protein
MTAKINGLGRVEGLTAPASAIPLPTAYAAEPAENWQTPANLLSQLPKSEGN